MNYFGNQFIILSLSIHKNSLHIRDCGQLTQLSSQPTFWMQKGEDKH